MKRSFSIFFVAAFAFVSSLALAVGGSTGSGTTITALTGDVTATGPGSAAATIAAATVTGKLLTGFASGGSMPVASTDTVREGVQKLNAAVVTNTADLTALKVGGYSGHIEAGSDKSYFVDVAVPFAGTVNTLKIKTVSGTATAAVKINGTSVTGISAVSVTSTIATGTATAANTFVAGDIITLVLSSSSSPVDLAYTIKYTR